MPCTEKQPLSKEAQEQLALLENSQGLIRSILLGISLQYKALEQQKQLLLGQAQNPQNADAACLDPKNIQIAASLIVLYALFGFQQQAEDIARQTAQTGVCPDWTEPKLNATVNLVALLRLCRLISPENSPAAESAASAERQAETLELQEISEEPAI